MKIQNINLFEQIRITCLLVYVIGAIFFILKHYNLISRDLNLASSWLVGISVALFLTLSFSKLMSNCFDSVHNQKGKELLHDSQVRRSVNNKPANKVAVFRYVGSTILVFVCVFSGYLLVLNNFFSVNKDFISDIYSVTLVVGTVLIGLYFGFRTLSACLGICSNFADNINVEGTENVATKLVVKEIENQLLSSFSVV
ncbi:hypothetical protein EDL79_00870 [Ehrlichia ruminantium]|uniref:Uncharacterized protein n=1 Tax=Ehrlichia ruminantium TaxID=779 RepID=A0AAE6Q8R9_EHRRU|nr:hypothetical protein [Ehrlichia ruminantium]QGR02244.1 hypothetical protein EDL81_00870 [Ehrlichia ruminantium]QGR03166.1 hypothetical protein EDL80_00870 [Ehrlichia ruminantium]QGR04091.1 hypothetical protein EDL79_00870 [Ehrlichia ruminantium]